MEQVLCELRVQAKDELPLTPPTPRTCSVAAFSIGLDPSGVSSSLLDVWLSWSESPGSTGQGKGLYSAGPRLGDEASSCPEAPGLLCGLRPALGAFSSWTPGSSCSGHSLLLDCALKPERPFFPRKSFLGSGGKNSETVSWFRELVSDRQRVLASALSCSSLGNV